MKTSDKSKALTEIKSGAQPSILKDAINNEAVLAELFQMIAEHQNSVGYVKTFLATPGLSSKMKAKIVDKNLGYIVKNNRGNVLEAILSHYPPKSKNYFYFLNQVHIFSKESKSISEGLASTAAKMSNIREVSEIITQMDTDGVIYAISKTDEFKAQEDKVELLKVTPEAEKELGKAQIELNAMTVEQIENLGSAISYLPKEQHETVANSIAVNFLKERPISVYNFRMLFQGFSVKTINSVLRNLSSEILKTKNEELFRLISEYEELTLSKDKAFVTAYIESIQNPEIRYSYLTSFLPKIMDDKSIDFDFITSVVVNPLPLEKIYPFLELAKETIARENNTLYKQIEAYSRTRFSKLAAEEIAKGKLPSGINDFITSKNLPALEQITIEVLKAQQIDLYIKIVEDIKPQLFDQYVDQTLQFIVENNHVEAFNFIMSKHQVDSERFNKILDAALTISNLNKNFGASLGEAIVGKSGISLKLATMEYERLESNLLDALNGKNGEIFQKHWHSLTSNHKLVDEIGLKLINTIDNSKLEKASALIGSGSPAISARIEERINERSDLEISAGILPQSTSSDAKSNNIIKLKATFNKIVAANKEGLAAQFLVLLSEEQRDECIKTEMVNIIASDKQHVFKDISEMYVMPDVNKFNKLFSIIEEANRNQGMLAGLKTLVSTHNVRDMISKMRVNLVETMLKDDVKVLQTLLAKYSKEEQITLINAVISKLATETNAASISKLLDIVTIDIANESIKANVDAICALKNDELNKKIIKDFIKTDTATQEKVASALVKSFIIANQPNAIISLIKQIDQSIVANVINQNIAGITRLDNDNLIIAIVKNLQNSKNVISNPVTSFLSNYLNSAKDQNLPNFKSEAFARNLKDVIAGGILSDQKWEVLHPTYQEISQDQKIEIFKLVHTDLSSQFGKMLDDNNRGGAKILFKKLGPVFSQKLIDAELERIVKEGSKSEIFEVMMHAVPKDNMMTLLDKAETLIDDRSSKIANFIADTREELTLAPQIMQNLTDKDFTKLQENIGKLTRQNNIEKYMPSRLATNLILDDKFDLAQNLLDFDASKKDEMLESLFNNIMKDALKGNEKFTKEQIGFINKGASKELASKILPILRAEVEKSPHAFANPKEAKETIINCQRASVVNDHEPEITVLFDNLYKLYKDSKLEYQKNGNIVTNTTKDIFFQVLLNEVGAIKPDEILGAADTIAGVFGDKKVGYTSEEMASLRKSIDDIFDAIDKRSSKYDTWGKFKNWICNLFKLDASSINLFTDKEKEMLHSKSEELFADREIAGRRVEKEKDSSTPTI